jgi:3-dehydroquinate synthase
MQDFIVIIDAKISSLYPKILQHNSRSISIEAVEENKFLEKIPNIIKQLKKLGATKKTEILAVGGGIIQDIACFTANVYMRGLIWHFIPTTLLSMGDSCIGGKSSINVDGIKNLVGTFYPPKSITIDVNFLKTLSKNDITSGLFECIKICFASFNDIDFETCLELLKNYETNYEEIIFNSLKIKKWFIEIDEFDCKERQLLNFGHTIGHAIESVSNYKISHGVAVGLGMLVEVEFGNVDNSRTQKLKKVIYQLLDKEVVNIAKNLNLESLFNTFILDKKHSKENYYIITTNEEGFLERKSFSKDDTFFQTFTNILKSENTGQLYTYPF